MSRRIPGRLKRAGIFAFLVLSIGSACRPYLDIEGRFPASIKILTFNIRYDEPRDGINAWPRRKQMVAETVRQGEADIAGLQEALRSQILELEAFLPEYAWTGVGRDDGRNAGEFNPIFYRRDRFTLLDSGTFWLSETPESPGLKGWDAACARIVTWARLEDARDGSVLAVFNTHFDHIGAKARLESAGLLLRALTRGGPADAIVVTGDFNCTEKDPPYLRLIEEENGKARLQDARVVSRSRPSGPSYSFNGFKSGGAAGSRIDHIFVGPDIAVIRCGILSELWGDRFASDHFAVLAEIRVRPRRFSFP